MSTRTQVRSARLAVTVAPNPSIPPDGTPSPRPTPTSMREEVEELIARLMDVHRLLDGLTGTFLPPEAHDPLRETDGNLGLLQASLDEAGEMATTAVQRLEQVAKLVG